MEREDVAEKILLACHLPAKAHLPEDTRPPPPPPAPSSILVGSAVSLLHCLQLQGSRGRGRFSKTRPPGIKWVLPTRAGAGSLRDTPPADPAWATGRLHLRPGLTFKARGSEGTSAAFHSRGRPSVPCLRSRDSRVRLGQVLAREDMKTSYTVSHECEWLTHSCIFLTLTWRCVY